MTDPVPPSTFSQRFIEALTLLTVFVGLGLACYGYWSWSRWRDAQVLAERTRHQAEVDSCKQACDARR